MLALLLFVLSLTTFGMSCSLVMLGSAREAETDWGARQADHADIYDEMSLCNKVMIVDSGCLSLQSTQSYLATAYTWLQHRPDSNAVWS
jgi:hypothetical protein